MHNKGKIAFFMQDLSGGGAEKMMVQLANNFVEKGYVVDLVLVRYEGPYKEELSDCIDVISFDSDRTYKSIFKFFKYLKKNCPTAIVATLPHINLIAIVVNLLLFKKTKVIIREASPLKNYLDIKYPLIKAAAIIAPFLYVFADKCIAITKGLKKELQKRMPLNRSNVVYIYNPVLKNKNPSTRVNSKNLKYKDEIFSNPEVQVVITAGRLESVKNYSTLIQAFALINKKIRLTKLVIAGEGSLAIPLRKQAINLGLEKDVFFIGFVDNLFEYMQRSNLFVLSSKYEGFGNVLVEALACNLPIVSTDCPYGPSEILQNGKYGSLVPVGDYKAMAEASIKILNGEKKFTGLRERAMDFHVDKIAEQYLKVVLENHE